MSDRPASSHPDDADKAADEPSSRAEIWKVWGPVLVLAVAAFAYTFSKLEPPAPRQLDLAAGSRQGAYHAFALRYAEVLAREGFELRVIETAGSQDNLQRLESGQVDLAVLQGGLADHDRNPDLQSLGSAFFEPLWVFHRGGLGLDLLGDLRGLRVATGAEGSGTRALVTELLADNGLDAGNTELLALDSERSVTGLRDGTVDVACFVASAAAGYIGELLADETIELMSLRRHRAYHVEHRFLSHVVLGEGVLDIRRNLPPRDISLVAAAAGLVSHKDLHHALVPLLVEAMQEVHGEGGLFEEPGTFPTARWTELPMPKEAVHFLNNGRSFLYDVIPGYRTAAAVDRLKIFLLPFIPLLLVVFKAAPPLYRWRIRSKIYRWYDDLRRIDHQLLDEPPADAVRDYLRTLEVLEREVTEVTVPLSYMDEFYDLRGHIELIKAKLRRLDGASAAEPDGP